MPDTTIHPTGVVSAPGDYVVPQAAELLLKGAYATFDGSGAAGDFQPLLRVISDAGQVALESAADTTVVAGESADASWFPHIGAAAVAAPPTPGPGVVVAAWDSTTGYTWTSGMNNLFEFGGFVHGSTNSSVISVNSTRDGMVIHKDGMYLVMGLAEWDTGFAGTASISLGGINLWNYNTSASIIVVPVAAPSRDGVGGGTSYLQTWGVAVEILGGGTTQLNLFGEQTSGADQNVKAALFCTRLGVFS